MMLNFNVLRDVMLCKTKYLDREHFALLQHNL